MSAKCKKSSGEKIVRRLWNGASGGIQYFLLSATCSSQLSARIVVSLATPTRLKSECAPLKIERSTAPAARLFFLNL